MRRPAFSVRSGAAAEQLRVPSARSTELWLLVLVVLVLAAFSAAAQIGLAQKLQTSFLLLPVLLGVVFLIAHITVRFIAPYADPVILPAVALLNGLGVLFLRRLDLGVQKVNARLTYPLTSGLGFRQLLWTAAAIIGFCALIIVVRDHRSLSRCAYTLGLAGLVLVALPGLLPARISEVNGAKLWIKFGWFSIQPGEFAKILLLIFFAYYLVRKREVLSLASRRIAGIDFPRGRDLGPVVAAWTISMLMLALESDLGTALMFFGIFIVTLYIATERVSWVVIGLFLFAGGAYLAYVLVPRFALRVSIWLHPFADADGKGYQLVQSLFGLGTGGLFGTGVGSGQPSQVPEAYNDFITAGFGEEIGLFGLTAILMLYLLIAIRGLGAGLGIRDSFGKLLAGGLSFVLIMQVFVIVGGVSKLIPLTGQTTPFLSAGGSSLVANWLLVALLLRVSDTGRRPITSDSRAPMGPVKLHDVPTEVVRL